MHYKQAVLDFDIQYQIYAGILPGRNDWYSVNLPADGELESDM